MIWRGQTVLEKIPVKAGTWVFFSACGNVLVTCNVFDGVVRHDSSAQHSQTFVLRHFKITSFKTFKFNANRVVVAIDPAPIA